MSRNASGWTCLSPMGKASSMHPARPGKPETASFVRVFISADHGSDQVLAVLQAGKDNPGHMQADESQQGPADSLMQQHQPGVSPKHVSGCQPAGEAQQRQAGQQGQHHPAP